MPQRLAGKVAVVTGANQGIGKAIAQALAAEGCKLALCARNVTKLHVVATELQQAGAEVFAQPTDVSDESAVEALFRGVDEKFGRVDLLVNNAGAFDGGPFD